jgi:ubiquinone/menaquinone biosynthesis C-methylase UbiE
MLVELLAPNPGWHVLDLGTGAGHAAIAVAPHVAHVAGVDVSRRMLATAGRLCSERGISNVELVQADVRRLPFPAQHFDAAISRFSAHHWLEVDSVAGELARVLRPEAPFMLIDTISPEDLGLDSFLNALELLRDGSHVRNARVNEWQDRLTRHDFRIETVRTWQIELETEDWLLRSSPPAWRAEAALRLLAEAPALAREGLRIAGDDTRFSLPCALIQMRRTAS